MATGSRQGPQDGRPPATSSAPTTGKRAAGPPAAGTPATDPPTGGPPTTGTPATGTPTPARERILSRPLVMGMLTNFGALTSYYLLASVLPLYAADTVRSGGGAGLATAVMMLACVLAEAATPALLARFGYRAVLALGLLLLGLPSLLPLAAGGLAVLLAVCLARGAGLGIMVVGCTTLAAELVPPSRRGEGLGLSGVFASVPSVVGLPLGLWITQGFGYEPVFIAAAITGLIPVLAVIGVPTTRPARGARTRRPPRRVRPAAFFRPAACFRASAATGRPGIGRWVHGPRPPSPGRVGPATDNAAGLRRAAIVRPTAVFASVTLATGVITTFLPLAAPDATLRLVPAALLVQSLVTPFARWWAGRAGDRRGPAVWVAPGLVLTGVGTALLAWAGSPVALLGGMALFGMGFGIAQNATLTVMLSRVRPTEYSRISALWNLAYDGGLGIGAAGFGLLAAGTGYPLGFALTGAVVLAMLAPALRDLRTPATDRTPLAEPTPARKPTPDTERCTP